MPPAGPQQIQSKIERLKGFRSAKSGLASEKARRPIGSPRTHGMSSDWSGALSDW